MLTQRRPQSSLAEAHKEGSAAVVATASEMLLQRRGKARHHAGNRPSWRQDRSGGVHARDCYGTLFLWRVQRGIVQKKRAPAICNAHQSAQRRRIGVLDYSRRGGSSPALFTATARMSCSCEIALELGSVDVRNQLERSIGRSS